MPTLPVVLIGPINAGKSTIAALLAERLDVPHCSLDDLSWGYFDDAGYDKEAARKHFERGGQAAAREYMVQFYAGAVERVLAEHTESVIDFGAGHTVHDDEEGAARMARALAPHPNVVLLLPSPDPAESIRILKERQSNPFPEIVALNEQFVRHPSYRELATVVVYTKERTPEETCEEILSRLR